MLPITVNISASREKCGLQHGRGMQKKNEWAQCHCLHNALNTTSFGTPRTPSENIPIQHSLKRQTLTSIHKFNSYLDFSYQESDSKMI